MPHRDDFEDFDKSNEGLVSQIGVKSVDDEDIDVALKLAHVDMYERLLREVRFNSRSKGMLNPDKTQIKPIIPPPLPKKQC